jgi:ferredoxin
VRGNSSRGLASPFTLVVIADLLGIPDEDRDSFISGLFAIGDGGYAEVLVDEVPEEYLDAVAEAVSCCPEQAIKTVEGE